MKKIDKANEFLWLLGIIFVALGVSICSKANLGVSMIAAPAFIISEVLVTFWNVLNVGVTEYIIQGVLLILLCIVVLKFNWRYLLAFLVAIIYGYTLNLFLWLLGGVEFSGIWLRWIMLIVGDVITAFGVACYFRTYMPLQVYELFVAEVAERFKFNLTKTKWTFDIILLVFSIILATTLFGDINSFDWSTIWYASFHNIGLGTIITTLINSPIILFCGKIINKIFISTPRFEKMHSLLKRS